MQGDWCVCVFLLVFYCISPPPSGCCRCCSQLCFIDTLLHTGKIKSKSERVKLIIPPSRILTTAVVRTCKSGKERIRKRAQKNKGWQMKWWRHTDITYGAAEDLKNDKSRGKETSARLILFLARNVLYAPTLLLLQVTKIEGLKSTFLTGVLLCWLVSGHCFPKPFFSTGDIFFITFRPLKNVEKDLLNKS